MRKHRTFLKKILFIILISFISIMTGLSVRAEKKNDESINIVLDPGHGGSQSGAERGEVYEKTRNLKIGKYLKEELEKYENVKVYMTRDSDQYVDLDERSQFCQDVDADLMVSLHNNAAGDMAAYHNGCTVLTSMGQYREKLAVEEQELAVHILSELSGLGLENQGILLRLSQEGMTYPNGETADYYRLVKNGINDKIPCIIVEHAFMDNDEDYENYLSEDEQLKKLAQADARGIARYYRLPLKKDGSLLEPLGETKEKLVQVVDDDYRHNIVTYKVFFQNEVQESTATEENQQETTTGTTTEKNQQEATTEILPEKNLPSTTEIESTTQVRPDEKQEEQKKGNDAHIVRKMIAVTVVVILLLLAYVILLRQKRDKDK